MLRVDHWRRGVECRLGVGDGRKLPVNDFDAFAGILGLGAAARHDGADRFALPAGAIHGERILRRRFQTHEMRQHADPRGHHGHKLGPAHHRHDARRLLGGAGIDRDDARMGVRRAHEGDMRHARQHDVADELRASGGQARQIGPRHRAADIGIRAVERAQDRRHVGGDLQDRPPCRSRATASTASTMAW